MLYDLLVGSVPLKIHPNDSSHNWARLLIRLLPVADYSSKKSEMSVLRLLSENEVLANHPHIPKFEIDNAVAKFKGIFQGKDAVTRLLDSLHSFLKKDDLKSLVVWPGKERQHKLTNTVALKPAQVLSPHRSWIVPRITDYSRSEFYLDVQVCRTVEIPLIQLKSFCSKPLALIKLDSFVQYLSRAECRLPVVSREMPFDLTGDRASKTHCSVKTMQRIYSDVQKYADKTNSEKVPTLVGFSFTDIEALHDDKGRLHSARKQLGQLVKILHSCMQFDRQSLKNLMKRALAICNSDERSDDRNAGIHHECQFMRYRLGQASDREPVAWFDLLVASILSTSSEQDIMAMNPFLSNSAYKTVTHLTVVAMLTAIRIGQTHRALSRLVYLHLIALSVLLRGSDLTIRNVLIFQFFNYALFLA